MKNQIFPSRVMNPICEQAGCDPETASKHAWKWEIKRWHAHPSMAFTGWWSPCEFDSSSGAHIGGHPNARRQWARKDPEGWQRKWYGLSCLDAWNTAEYVEQFNAWTEAGQPEKSEPFISIATAYDEQKDFWPNLRGILDKIGKRMSKALPFDSDSKSFHPY